MQEKDLRLVLQKLGIRVESRNEQRAKQRVFLNFHCPMAQYSAAHKFQADRNPSAGASADNKGGRSRWFCLACKGRGSLVDLAQKLKAHERKAGMPYDLICEEITSIESTGLGAIQWGQDVEIAELGEPLVEEAYEGLYPAAWDVPEARAYLEARRIGQAASEAMELLFDDGATPPDDWRGPWTPQPRILFPVRSREGGLYGWSGRATYPKPKVKVRDYSGLPKEHLILGSHRWRAGLPLLIVEGLFAYARQVENRVDEIANVGALLGSEMTLGKVEIIRLFGEPTYMLPDLDAAGDACLFGPLIEDEFDPRTGEQLRNAEKGAVHHLHGHVPLFLPTYPEGKTDPDDLTFEDVAAMLRETSLYGVREVTWGGFLA